MSKGPGRIEHAILQHVTDQLTPLWCLAQNAGYDATTRAVQQTFLRAANNLRSLGEIGTRWVTVDGSHRLCVHTAHSQPTDTAHIERMFVEMFGASGPQFDAFILRQIKQKRWTAVDAVTGEPVDLTEAWLESGS